MSASPLLDGIASPEDLRALAPEDVARVAAELRREIIDNISRTGGHLASSLVHFPAEFRWRGDWTPAIFSRRNTEVHGRVTSWLDPVTQSRRAKSYEA